MAPRRSVVSNNGSRTLARLGVMPSKSSTRRSMSLASGVSRSRSATVDRPLSCGRTSAQSRYWLSMSGRSRRPFAWSCCATDSSAGLSGWTFGAISTLSMPSTAALRSADFPIPTGPTTSVWWRCARHSRRWESSSVRPMSVTPRFRKAGLPAPRQRSLAGQTGPQGTVPTAAAHPQVF